MEIVDDRFESGGIDRWVIDVEQAREHTLSARPIDPLSSLYPIAQIIFIVEEGREGFTRGIDAPSLDVSPVPKEEGTEPHIGVTEPITID